MGVATEDAGFPNSQAAAGYYATSNKTSHNQVGQRARLLRPVVLHVQLHGPPYSQVCWRRNSLIQQTLAVPWHLHLLLPLLTILLDGGVGNDRG